MQFRWHASLEGVPVLRLACCFFSAVEDSAACLLFLVDIPGRFPAVLRLWRMKLGWTWLLRHMCLWRSFLHGGGVLPCVHPGCRLQGGPHCGCNQLQY